MNLMIKLALLFSAFVSLHAEAAAVLQIDGRILKPDGTPLSGTNAQFRLQIRTPNAGNCLMYEETQTQDMSQSQGYFALGLNDGNGVRSDSTGLSIDRVFANRGTFSFTPSTCSIGSAYSPSATDGRSLVVYFRDETMSTWEAVPSQKIDYVPLALEANQIQGFAAENLLRFAESNGTLVSTSPLNNAQYTELLALVNGTSTAFERAGRLGGAVLPAMGAGQVGQVLTWNGTSWASTETVPSNTVTTVKIVDSAITSAKIADGTITGADFAPNIAINTSSTVSTTGTMSSNISTTRDLRLYDQDASPNENYVSLRAPAALATNSSYIWPGSYGVAGQVLATDGAGNLSWENAAAQWTNGSGGSIAYPGGPVGIGTNTPLAKLDVLHSDSETARFASSSVNGNVVAFVSSAGASRHVALKLMNQTGLGFGLILDPANTNTNNFGIYDLNSSQNRMMFTPSGAVGVGISSPTSLLHLGPGTASMAPLRFTTGSLLGTPQNGTVEYDNTSLYFTIGSTRYLIPMMPAAGNFTNVQMISNVSSGITLSTSPGSSVLIDQSTVSVSPTTGALVVVGGVGVAGNINSGGNITAAGTVTQSSDIRFKKNIVPIAGALEKVLQLNGYNYDWIEPEKHNKGRQIGLIAQEVEAVFPEAVLTNKDGYKSVSYTALVAPVVSAVKTLFNRSVSQERRIQELEAENAQMKQDLDAIKKALSGAR